MGGSWGDDVEIWVRFGCHGVGVEGLSSVGDEIGEGPRSDAG